MPPVPKTPVAKKSKAAGPVDTVRWPFGKRNYIVFGASLVVIIAGYFFLAGGSITLAPLLLVVGYCILIPVGIMIKDPDLEANQSKSSDSQG